MSRTSTPDSSSDSDFEKRIKETMKHVSPETKKELEQILSITFASTCSRYSYIADDTLFAQMRIVTSLCKKLADLIDDCKTPAQLRDLVSDLRDSQGISERTVAAAATPAGSGCCKQTEPVNVVQPEDDAEGVSAGRES